MEQVIKNPTGVILKNKKTGKLKKFNEATLEVKYDDNLYEVISNQQKIWDF